jgi:hypothetical protein
MENFTSTAHFVTNETIFSVYLSWIAGNQFIGNEFKTCYNEYSFQQNYKNPIRVSDILGGILWFLHAPAKYRVCFFMPVFNRFGSAARWLEFV